jgi:hypothetical protein
MPTTRVKLTTVSHDLPRVQPRAQQGAPPRPTSGLSLSLGLGRRSPPRPTPGLGLSLGLGRSHNLARPQPRPQEKSPPRLISASDRLRHKGYFITLPLASCLRLRRNKTGVPSRLLRQRVMMVPSACVHDVDCSQLSTKANKRQQDPGRTASCASTGLKYFSACHVSAQLHSCNTQIV